MACSIQKHGKRQRGVLCFDTLQALARTLVAAPQLLQGQSVLELGAGCGLVGLLAARLGASQVGM